MANEKGVWRTIGGRRVFIKEGQDLASAMKESGKFKSASKGTAKKESTQSVTDEELKAKYDELRKDRKGLVYNLEEGYLKDLSNEEKLAKLNKELDDINNQKENIKKIDKEAMDYQREKHGAKGVEEYKKYMDQGDDTLKKATGEKNKEDNKGEYKMYDKFEYKDGQLTAYDSYGKEVDSYGLSKEDYEENPKYWQDKFKEETNREAMNEINGSDIKLANELRKETEKKYNSLKEKQKNGYGISKEDLEDFVNNSNYQKRDELINSDKEFKKQIDSALENYNMNIKDMDRKAFEDAMGYNKEKTWRDKIKDPNTRNEILDKELDESTKSKTKEFWNKEDSNGTDLNKFNDKAKASFGKIDYYGNGRKSNEVEIEMQLKDGVFTASGSIKNARGTDSVSGGQNIDEIADLMKNNKDVQEIHSLWKKYHLNQMHAGTEKQEEALEKFKGERKAIAEQMNKGKQYDWQKVDERDYEVTKKLLENHNLLEDDGYKYGTSWLKREIPDDDKRRIISLINKYNGKGADSTSGENSNKTTNQSMNDTLRNAFNDYRKKHKNSNMSFTEFMRINKK